MSCRVYRLRQVVSGSGMGEVRLVLEQVAGDASATLAVTWISSWPVHPAFGRRLSLLPGFASALTPPCHVSLCPQRPEAG